MKHLIYFAKFIAVIILFVLGNVHETNAHTSRSLKLSEQVVCPRVSVTYAGSRISQGSDGKIFFLTEWDATFFNDDCSVFKKEHITVKGNRPPYMGEERLRPISPNDEVILIWSPTRPNHPLTSEVERLIIEQTIAGNFSTIEL